MALKFLNKKGWHTGSLRNIETVWKAEQKHGAEQKKLEELRKQIQEERERSEFRLLQEQAGLVPKQERLDFLYESGLAVGKTSEGFKALAAPPAPAESAAAEPSSSKAAAAAVPGALFEDKPQSANDAWRKLHSDPLLLIRQREKEAVDRIKNNPMKMAMIQKSVETEKKHKRDRGEKKKDRKRKHKSKREKHSTKASSDPEGMSGDEEERRKTAHSTHGRRHYSSSKHDISADLVEERKTRDGSKHSSRTRSDSRSTNGGENERRKDDDTRRRSKHHEEEKRGDDTRAKHREEEKRGDDTRRSEHREEERRKTEDQASKSKESYNRHRGVPKLSEEERAARLREMQMDAELHEEQRWKRLKKADEADAREAVRAASSSSAGGKNFLDAAKASIYGAEKGGSSTIEESLRRRAYYSQGSAAHESNAFRR